MTKVIIKRNYEKEHFQPYKIEDAIKKAFLSESKPYDDRVFKEVMKEVDALESIGIEEIQDIIEKSLFKYGNFDILKSFMLYRHTHKMQREHIEGLTEDTTYVSSTQTVEEYINKSDWRIKANSNTGYSNAGLINNTAGKVVANYWLDKIYSKEEGAAHRTGDYHIHDLDCLTAYCAGWSLRVLLNEGFNGVRGRVSSNPPKHLREALGQMANFLGILQSEWAGAQAFSSFDTYLAPYVFKDNMKYKDIKKAITTFIYNLNVPSRWGQSPFTNITIDWTVPEDLKTQIPTTNDIHLFKDTKDEDLIKRARERGVENPEDLTFGHFQKEMNLINRAYYEVMTQGDSGEQPFTFPIPTVNITEDFDWDGENTDVLFENTAKVGSSYFQNFIGSQYIRDEKGNLVPNEKAYKPGHVRSMCCRLQLDLRELLKRGGGLFGSAEMTGSIGVVTINMARLGYLYKGDMKSLVKQLDHLMDMAKSTLEKKRVFVQSMYDRGLYPYTARYLPGFKNHFSTIGVNGINEMIRNFTDDKEDIATKYGETVAMEILDHIRARMVEYQEETGNLYNLEATPAEGTTHRFAKEDRKRYEGILQAGREGEPGYYTNSSQLPANFTNDPFLALDMQDSMQCQYTGGTVLHLYMEERIKDIETCKKFVKSIISNYKLPYVTITPIFSVCPKHGYINGMQEFCPKCDAELLAEDQKSNKKTERVAVASQPSCNHGCGNQIKKGA